MAEWILLRKWSGFVLFLFTPFLESSNSVTRQRSGGELNSHYPMVILFEDCIHLRVKLQTVLFLAHLQGGSKPRNVMMRVWNVTGTSIMPTTETNIHWKRPMLPILARKPSTFRVIVSLLLWVGYGQEKRQKIGSMHAVQGLTTILTTDLN